MGSRGKFFRQPQRAKDLALGVAAVVTLGLAAAVGTGHLPAKDAGAGVLLQPEPTPPPTPEPNLRMAVIGDSYTETHGDGTDWPSVLAAHLGRYLSVDAAVGGTGYTAGRANHTDFGSRVDQVIATDPGLVIVFGSRNDSYFTRAETQNAALTALTRLKRGLPTARIVIVGPSWVEGQPPPGDGERPRQAVRAAAASLGLSYIDPVAEVWLPTAHPEWVGTDHVHPTNSGHTHFADLFEAHLLRLGIGPA